MLLARKVAGALPGLSASDEADLRDRTLATLSALVRDEAVRVRVLLAGVMADLPDVPKDLVLTLAQDASVSVSDPVLRLSPLLSPADLLELLRSPPHDCTAAAIACRANLPAAVSDVIAASADSAAIRALLANASAAIRESTLDALVERAHDEPDWHLPLVQRPQLPEHAARALAQILASDLLKRLAERGDLPPGLVLEIRQRLGTHLMQPVRKPADDEALMDEARRLEEAGKLNEAAVLAIVRTGDVRRATSLLAVAAGVPLDVVDRAAALRSAKALVSLVWKAGFSMRLGVPIQSLLGQLAPGAALTSTRMEGFPISAEELGWQLDFLGCSQADLRMQ